MAKKKKGTIEVVDVGDGIARLTVNFNGKVDYASPAHCMLRCILEEIDRLGLVIATTEPAPAG